MHVQTTGQTPTKWLTHSTYADERASLVVGDVWMLWLWSTRELAVDDRDEGGVCLLVCGDHETADPGVNGLPAKARDDAPCGLTEGDATGEMHTAPRPSVGDLPGASTGRHPRHRKGGGHNARDEGRHKHRVGQHPNGAEVTAVGYGGSRLTSISRELYEGTRPSSVPPRRT